MNICANVINASRYKPKPNESVLVDTQVWLALAYAPSTRNDSDEYRFRPYIATLRKLRQARAVAYISVLSISEMASFIERSQYQIATKTPVFDRWAFKSWRNSSTANRERVWISLQACVQTIEDYARILPMPAISLVDIIDGFRGSSLDAMDNLLVQQAKANHVPSILTDDRDFGSAEGMRIITANRQLLKASRPAPNRDW